MALSWPWPFTPRPKISGIFHHIIRNLHAKFESDWAKLQSVSCQGFISRVPKLTFTFDPYQKGSSSNHPQITCEVLKWLGKNCSLYCAHKVLYTVPKLTLTFEPQPKIERVPPLIMINFHVKFESDWAKNCCRILPTRFYTQCQIWPWPLTLWSKINSVHRIIINNLHVKFESDWAKTSL